MVNPSIRSLSSWGWIVGAIVVAAIGATLSLYLMREQVGDSSRAVIESLGAGIVPISLWSLVFLWSLTLHRSSFRSVNLWIGSLALVAFTVGVLGFFQPADGPLAAFTLDGEVSLGGEMGAALAGPSMWRGALLLAAILAIGVAVASPALAGAAVTAAASLSVLAYVAAVATGGALRRMYRPARADARNASGTAGQHVEGTTIPEGLAWRQTGAAGDSFAPAAGPDEPAMALDFSSATVGTDEPDTAPITGSESSPPAADTDEPGTASPAVEEPFQQQEETSMVDTDEYAFVFDEDQAPDPLPDAAPSLSETPASGLTPIPGGKFNRFWDSVNRDGESNGAAADVSTPHIQELTSASVSRLAALSWRLPDLDLLQDVPDGGISKRDLESTAETIRSTLEEYGVEVEIGQIKPGPAVTMYGLTPGWVRRYKQVRVKGTDGKPRLDQFGKQMTVREESKTRVKVDSILSREKDLALALKTPSIRIETPVMGESLVGIEVPNPTPSRVTLRSVMESEEFAGMRKKAQLPVALGRGSGGDTVVIDLAAMPHLLIAGATGAGKSACLNSIISCLMLEKTPNDVRLLLIDPKRVELTPFNGVPHLMTPVVVETDQVVGLLKGLIREMMDRYRRFEGVGVRNIATYNQRAAEKMPLLVVAVDELADLMMSAAFDVEQSLCRLAQLGRATGIHLIVATQRPSVDVVTGLIKANFPSRISFAVTSHIDSRTILDSAGADKLLGKGDMLYLPLDASRPERVQGVFISDEEVEELVRYWQTTPWASLDAIHLHIAEEGTDGDSEDQRMAERDELLDKAIELAHSYNKLSTSLLQRRMRIGYPRAARLMDQLEEQGIVGPSDGSKSRDVIIG